MERLSWMYWILLYLTNPLMLLNSQFVELRTIEGDFELVKQLSYSPVPQQLSKALLKVCPKLMHLSIGDFVSCDRELLNLESNQSFVAMQSNTCIGKFSVIHFYRFQYRRILPEHTNMNLESLRPVWCFLTVRDLDWFYRLFDKWPRLAEFHNVHESIKYVCWYEKICEFSVVFLCIVYFHFTIEFLLCYSAGE